MEGSDIVVYDVNYADAPRERSYSSSHTSGSNRTSTSSTSKQQSPAHSYHGGGDSVSISSASRRSSETTYDHLKERRSYTDHSVQQRPSTITAWDNNTLINHRTPSEASWRKDYFGPQRLGRARVIFTGPDGLGPHRVAVDDEHRYIGNGAQSVELSSEADYLWRPASTTPFPLPKSAFAGAIGWGVQELQDYNYMVGSPIKLRFARQECEQRVTHQGQGAWNPPYEYGFWRGPNHARPQTAPEARNFRSNNDNNNHTVYDLHQRQQHRYSTQVRF